MRREGLGDDGCTRGFCLVGYLLRQKRGGRFVRAMRLVATVRQARFFSKILVTIQNRSKLKQSCDRYEKS